MRSQELETIIVGGGPAGIATALFLANADPKLTERIVVLEKERYPREKFCAGGIGARADRLLARAGVVVDVPSVEISSIALRVQGRELVGSAPHIGRTIRRIEYDHELANIAKARGIRVVEGARVDGVAIDREGVTVRSSAGVFRARALVGADGVGSFVRRAMGLPGGRLRAQVIELDTEAVSGDPPRDRLLFDISYPNLTGYAWDFPTLVDGEELICRGVFHLKTAGSNGLDIRAVLARRLEERGLDIDRYRIKRFGERGFEVHAPYAAPRVLLVGEAAGIDPVTGEGIAQAIEYGAFAGSYLAEKQREGDYAFADFTRRLGKARVGLDLAMRSRIAGWFYGDFREPMEGFLLDNPEFLTLGVRYFGGLRVPRGELAKVGASAGWHTLRALWKADAPREAEAMALSGSSR